MIGGATVCPYTNASTKIDGKKIGKVVDSKVPRSRSGQIRDPPLHAGGFKSLLYGDTTQILFDNAPENAEENPSLKL